MTSKIFTSNRNFTIHKQNNRLPHDIYLSYFLASMNFNIYTKQNQILLSENSP